MKAVWKVVVLTRSIAWKSAIESLLLRELPQAKIAWALDIEDFMAEVAKQAHVAGVIELTVEHAESDIRYLNLHRENCPAARYFAVGDDWLADQLLTLRECGFFGNCHSLMHLHRLTDWLKQHFSTLPPADLSIEELLAERLQIKY